jgi:hypothetical protein
MEGAMGEGASKLLKIYVTDNETPKMATSNKSKWK